MGKLKIQFKPLFLIYVFFCIYFNWFNSIFYYVLAVVLHEYGHYCVAKFLGYNMNGIVFSVFGGGINTDNNFKRRDELFISIAGPLVNLVLIIISICLWWIFPMTYVVLYDFVVCNLVVMLFNLIPIYPLDGGRIIVSLITKKFNRNKILKINYVFSCIIGVFCILLFIISLFVKLNFSFLFIGFFLIMNSFSYKNDIYKIKIDSLNKKINKPIEIKTFRVSTLNKKILISYLSPHYISIFEYDDGQNLIQISEDDLLKL